MSAGATISAIGAAAENMGGAGTTPAPKARKRRPSHYVPQGPECSGRGWCGVSALGAKGQRLCKQWCGSKRRRMRGADYGLPAHATPPAPGAPAAGPTGTAQAAAETPERLGGSRPMDVDTPLGVEDLLWPASSLSHDSSSGGGGLGGNANEAFNSGLGLEGDLPWPTSSLSHDSSSGCGGSAARR